MKQALSVSALALGTAAMSASAAFDYTLPTFPNTDEVEATAGTTVTDGGSFGNFAQSLTRDTGVVFDSRSGNSAQAAGTYNMGADSLDVDTLNTGSTISSGNTNSLGTFEFHWVQVGDGDYTLEGAVAASLLGSGQYRYEVNLRQGVEGPFGTSFGPIITGNNPSNTYLFDDGRDNPNSGSFSEVVSLVDGGLYQLQITVQAAANSFDGRASDVSVDGFTSLTPVPTPATAALLGMGGLVATRRRR